ncbi:glycosyltransferase family 87 protein [Phytohabitans kaempferiae]|uniref:Glycosyltransferase family 87 protein n=1 Tax=Phytohabitans kaempferiae TaxID=1620943 RepID=A0ABV6MFU3_9ACTN
MEQALAAPARQWRSLRTGLALPLAVTGLAFLLGYWQKATCYAAAWPRGNRLAYAESCYSDIPVLFRERGLIAGIFPYAPESWRHPLEYPVLTGIVMDATARLTRAVGGGGESGLTRTYFDVNVVVLLGFALATVAVVWALPRDARHRLVGALLVASAPVLAFTGTINWDLVAVLAAVAALLAWSRGRPLVAGILIGLGTAAKLFPLFILGPLLLLCLRGHTMPAFARTATGAVAAWVAVNLPVALRYPDGWLLFFRFNSDRPAEVGSPWYGLDLVGWGVPALNLVAPLCFAALCAGVAWVAWRAPEPPAVAPLAFLVIAAFLMTNKVYSPQYVLWMLPFGALAVGALRGKRPLVVWGAWQAAEVLYWYMVWDHLEMGHRINGVAGALYLLSIVLRLAATTWLCAIVTRNMWTNTQPAVLER